MNRREKTQADVLYRRVLGVLYTFSLRTWNASDQSADSASSEQVNVNDEAVKRIQSASVSRRKEPLASISFHATHTPLSPHRVRSLHASSATWCTVG